MTLRRCDDVEGMEKGECHSDVSCKWESSEQGDGL